MKNNERQSKEPDIFQEFECEYRDLNNNLIVPSYRRWCKDNNLAFHFWDELPKSAFDPEIADKELELSKEAFDLFNRMKPGLVYFRGNIVKYQFTSWDGQFEHTSWDRDDFLRKTSEELSDLNRLKKRFKIAVSILSIVSVLVLSLVWKVVFGTTVPSRVLNFISIAVLAGGGALPWLFLVCLPKRKQERNRRHLEERLQKLRQELQ